MLCSKHSVSFTMPVKRFCHKSLIVIAFLGEKILARLGEKILLQLSYEDLTRNKDDIFVDGIG